MEENDDCDDLQLQTTSNFKADHVDAYDSDCDDQATASAIFMTSLSSVGLLNDDIVIPTYDSNTLSEVPYYDTYHDDVLNSAIQETKYNEHSVSHDDSYAELMSENNVIFYVEYMVTIQDEVDHYVPPPVQNKNTMLIQKKEDENVALAFQISSLVKEQEHLKLVYKNHYDSIKQTRAKIKLQTDSLQQKLNDQIFENNKLKEKLKAMFFESQMNQNGTSMNTKFVKSSTLRNKLYSVTPLPKSQFIPKVVEKNDLSKTATSHLTTNKIIEKCTKALALGLLMIESEPINAYFKNNRAMHRDYLKVTKEHVATLQELLKEARALKPLDAHIGHASKFTERIIELLVYVSASCPFTESENEKWAPTTSHKKNDKLYVDASRTQQTIKTITQKHAAKQNTQKTSNTMLPST
ncbi:hypothetical protein Tco_0472531 [Tanacetum coccineum]